MLKRIGATIVLLCQATLGSTEPYTPSPSEVVATWNTAQIKQLRGTKPSESPTDDPRATVELAEAYLAEAAQPGQAGLYGLAKATLKPLIEQSPDRPEVWLAWARVQQHQHAFDAALTAVDRVLEIDQHNISATLLAARVHLIQGNPDAARQACLGLLGHADLLTLGACSLEVTSYQGKLQASYEQLSELVNRQGLPDDERGPWLAQMLGDMAMRLGSPVEAVNWLHPQLEGADVTYLAQWADAQLSAANYRLVLDHLQAIVRAAPAMDDALLLRLAQAEKKLGGKEWQAQLAERVLLREQRQDIQHASDIARYYLVINPQPQKALHWARLNWQSAREHTDEQLLQQAQRLANSAVDIDEED